VDETVENGIGERRILELAMPQLDGQLAGDENAAALLTIFQQFEQIVKLVNDKNRPVQFIFAGKAHPRDDDGKRYIQQVIHLSKYSDLKGHLVFIENYDIHVARTMVSGCDVWLNNPRRPLEASGTSGQKAGCHGCLNLSILDGWWREGYDGTNGFSIGDDTHPANVEEQDKRDSENLYKALTEVRLFKFSVG